MITYPYLIRTFNSKDSTKHICMEIVYKEGLAETLEQLFEYNDEIRVYRGAKRAFTFKVTGKGLEYYMQLPIKEKNC